MKSRELKRHLRSGQVAIGTWVFEFNTPGIARLLATTGVDFIAYDMEHSGFGIESIRSLIAETRPLGLAALVRPPAGHYHLVATVLDVGASGVLVPMVETPEQAARIADACRYSPEGRRGVAFGVAHDDFLPGDVPAKMKAANESVVCGVLIETQRGVENLEKIVAVPGIDLVWVGHYDLSQTMGIPGEFDHPRFLQAIQHIIKTSASRGIPVGIMVSDAKQGVESVQKGFRCLAYWGDVWLLQKALTDGIRQTREGLKGLGT